MSGIQIRMNRGVYNVLHTNQIYCYFCSRSNLKITFNVNFSSDLNDMYMM